VTNEHEFVDWVDAATGRVTGRQPASQLDDSIRYVPGPDGEPVAVTRIEVLTAGDRREIRQVAADGTVLRTTYQARDPARTHGARGITRSVWKTRSTAKARMCGPSPGTDRLGGGC